MASIVEHRVEIAAPVTEVFAYVDDYTQTKDWMYEALVRNVQRTA